LRRDQVHQRIRVTNAVPKANDVGELRRAPFGGQIRRLGEQPHNDVANSARWSFVPPSTWTRPSHGAQASRLRWTMVSSFAPAVSVATTPRASSTDRNERHASTQTSRTLSAKDTPSRNPHPSPARPSNPPPSLASRNSAD